MHTFRLQHTGNTTFPRVPSSLFEVISAWTRLVGGILQTIEHAPLEPFAEQDLQQATSQDFDFLERRMREKKFPDRRGPCTNKINGTTQYPLLL